MNKPQHTPVLLHEILDNLPLIEVKTLVDGTTGLGGHLSKIIKKVYKSGSKNQKALAFDSDIRNLSIAKKRLSNSPIPITWINQNFGDLSSWAEEHNLISIDFMLLDLGLSSPHIDNSEAGFSYKQDGPLDMRFNQQAKLDATTIINKYPLANLQEIFRNYGELPKSRVISQTIVEARRQSPITKTSELTDLLSPLWSKKYRSKSLTLVYQALRIAVNDELTVLKKVLPTIIKLLTPHGRIAVISYHSLEDRIIKNFFRDQTKNCHCPPSQPICNCNFKATLKLVNNRLIIPTDQEIANNPRSRSAKLRIAEKI